MRVAIGRGVPRPPNLRIPGKSGFLALGLSGRGRNGVWVILKKNTSCRIERRILERLDDDNQSNSEMQSFDQSYETVI